MTVCEKGKRTSAENESWKTAENGGWKMTDKSLENGRQSTNSMENCRQFMENGRKHFLCIGKQQTTYAGYAANSAFYGVKLSV